MVRVTSDPKQRTVSTASFVAALACIGAVLLPASNTLAQSKTDALPSAASI